MPGPVSDALWKKYKKMVGWGAESFNKDQVIFAHQDSNVDRWGEDINITDPLFTYTNLDVLVQYNYFKTWPSNKETESGQIDRQTMVFLFNREYLRGLGGFLDAHGNFQIEPSADYFIHRGQEYRIEGDTLIAQAQDDPLHVMVIVRRQEVPTGEDRAYNNIEVIDRHIDVS